MSLYPSLEDMQVDKILKAQQNAFNQTQSAAVGVIPEYTQNPYPEMANNKPSAPLSSPSSSNNVMYPRLSDFMGLELSPQMIADNMPEYLQAHQQQQIAIPANTNVVTYQSNERLSNMIAPLSGNSVGLHKAHVTNGVRELVLCKGADKKVGLRVKDINAGIFVSIVVKDSPAALAGLRFGDQILQINGTVVAGYSIDKLHNLLKKSPTNNISVIVRDRPFERAITLHKDSRGNIGFQFNNGKIYNIVKDSSAARNGLLIDHQLLEINGQNCVGMKDKEITGLITNGGQIISITIMPSFLYEHMMKKLSSSFVRGIMDHSDF